MRPWQLGLVGSIAAGLMAGVAASPPQSTDVSADLVREPALQYFTKPATDAVARLNADLQRGAARLTFDDTGGYLPYLLTRIGWDTRVALQAGRPDAAAMIGRAAADVVDYLLLVDETPLPDRVTGTSGFAEKFSAEGPADRQGRSLRQLDLSTRLLRYPCSYMIYADAFDALPSEARDAIYRRLWDVLSRRETGAKYARLSAADRRAIVEILRDTKKNLPDYFQPINR